MRYVIEAPGPFYLYAAATDADPKDWLWIGGERAALEIPFARGQELLDQLLASDLGLRFTLRKARP